MIRIRSKQHLFRRCGVAHPAGDVDYPDGRFSGEELAILRAEPMLVVAEIPDPEPGINPPEPEHKKGRGKKE